ncbi:NDC1 [Mytilus coruscus]|uniref:NDC1 n=1 Tax=Mytilus coruscus TaxID=42192 RepID=A0A6J8EAJ7_MYTCO|nr:NDC1 [Mytilus coruscus]
MNLKDMKTNMTFIQPDSNVMVYSYRRFQTKPINCWKGSEQSVDTVYGLLDIGLCYQTILLGIFLHFMWSYSALLYRVYSTEHHTFPIESAFDNTANRCLIDAMSCQKDNLVKYLGFLDLSWLSKNSMERRAQVFSLSQPGGHPHNWNKLSTACLTEIDALNQKVQEENWKVFVNVPVRQTEKLTPVTVGDTTTLSHRTTPESTVNGTGDSQTNPSTAPKEGILSYLKKKPFFSFFLMDSPDAKSRQLFQGAQLQIWAIEALSNFATASYTEDKFGVVQRSLPSTLTSLLNLQENVEKYFKLAVTSSRRQTKDSMTKDAGLKYLLQTTLKSSLYKIVNTFGKHLMSLKLQPDATRKLKQFIEYKE